MNQAHGLESLQTLNEVGQILNREADFSTALPLVLVQLIKRLDLETGWIFLSTTAQGESRAGEFSLVAHAELPPALEENERAALCEGSCECQKLFQRGELDQGVNRVTCSRLKYASGATKGLRVHASIPLLTRTTPIGIINLAAQDEAPFSEEQLAFLTIVGRYLGTAFERSKLQRSQMREAVYRCQFRGARTASQGHSRFGDATFICRRFIPEQFGQHLKRRARSSVEGGAAFGQAGAGRIASYRRTAPTRLI